MKKILSSVLVLVLVLTALTGCGAAPVREFTQDGTISEQGFYILYNGVEDNTDINPEVTSTDAWGNHIAPFVFSDSEFLKKFFTIPGELANDFRPLVEEYFTLEFDDFANSENNYIWNVNDNVAEMISEEVMIYVDDSSREISYTMEFPEASIDEAVDLFLENASKLITHEISAESIKAMLETSIKGLKDGEASVVTTEDDSNVYIRTNADDMFKDDAEVGYTYLICLNIESQNW